MDSALFTDCQRLFIASRDGSSTFSTKRTRGSRFDALVARILRGNAGVLGRVVTGPAALGSDVELRPRGLTQGLEPGAPDPFDPGGAAFLTELLQEPDRLLFLTGAGQGLGVPEPLLATG
jgi:hypothetical protein